MSQAAGANPGAGKNLRILAIFRRSQEMARKAKKGKAKPVAGKAGKKGKGRGAEGLPKR